MRTARLIRHKADAMERYACSDTVGHGGSGLKKQRASHTVTLSADLLPGIHRPLCIEKGDIGYRVLFRSSWRIQPCHQLSQLCHVVLILETEFRDVEVQRGGFAGA